MKEIKKNFIKDFWHLMKGYKNSMIFIIFLLLAVQVLTIIPVYIIQRVIDDLMLEKIFDFAYFLPFIITFFVVELVVRFLEYIQINKSEKLEIEVENDLLNKATKKLLDLPLAYHEEQRTGSKLNKIQRGISDVRRLLVMSSWQFIPAFLTFLVYFGYLFYVNWFLTSIYFIVLPIFLLITFKLNIKSFAIKKKVRKKFENIYGNLGESIYNIKTVKSYVQEKREQNKLSKKYSVVRRLIIKWVKMFASYDFWRSFAHLMGKVIVLSLGIYFVIQGELTIGTLVLFVTLTNKITNAMWSLTHAFDTVVDASVGVERLADLLNEKSQIKQIRNSIKHDLAGGIEFRQVNFGYDKKLAIKNFNLKINPGEIVALVGPSGGGKTTITKLIYRYFDCDSGTILIDEQDLRNLNLNYYRKQLGMVSQDIDIFNDTVKDNIAYGDPKATLAAVKKAAEISNASEFIVKLKKKYNTIVGERGVKLSGGQKQRLGIARAILKNPKILILDEATSFLDADSEHKIQKAIDRVIKNRTTIIIAHRLSTIKHADKIVFIDNGKIKEQGSHEQLLRKNGAYAKLIKLQTQGYL